jgi:hypothetical protein
MSAVGRRLVRYKVTVTVEGTKGEQMQVTWAGYEGPPTPDDKDRLCTSAAAAFEAAFGVKSMKFHDDVSVQFDISKSDAVYLDRIDRGVKIVGLESRRHVETRLIPGGTVSLVGGKFLLTDAGDEALAEVRRTGFGAEVRAVAG